MRLAAFLIAALCPMLLLAAENTPQTTPVAEEELQAAEIETPADAPADTDLILADIDADTDTDNDIGNRRFIPTEEISQDLGVSFPVDI